MEGDCNVYALFATNVPIIGLVYEILVNPEIVYIFSTISGHV